MADAIARQSPWYRNKWPWLLMAGPAVAVVSGVATLLLAIASNDGLVADDYYKRGLAINQTLSRDRAAVRGHYSARVMFNPAQDRVRVMLRGDQAPAALTLKLAHPTRAGQDRTVALVRGAGGLYEGAMAALAPGHWGVSLEDAAGAWRLAGEWRSSGEPLLELGAE